MNKLSNLIHVNMDIYSHNVTCSSSGHKSCSVTKSVIRLLLGYAWQPFIRQYLEAKVTLCNYWTEKAKFTPRE